MRIGKKEGLQKKKRTGMRIGQKKGVAKILYAAPLPSRRAHLWAKPHAIRTGGLPLLSSSRIIRSTGTRRQPRTPSVSSQFKNNCFTEMRSGSEEGSYLRLIDC